MDTPTLTLASDAPRPSRRGRTLALGLAVALGLGIGASAEAALFKWVDEHGVVHYSDKVPPEAVDKGNVELNRQGVPIRRTDPAPSAEQRRAKDQEDERRRQAAKQQEEVARRDRALIASYTSENEIASSRERALGTIDAAMQSAGAYTERLTARKKELEINRAKYTDGKHAVPAVIEREYESVSEELQRQADLIVAKRKEREVVAARYDADRQRYRELAARGETSGSAPATSTPAPRSLLRK